ncbi:MAG: class I SAM-dependent methyltransferase [Treponemataceae bacterium]|nr:class I SAM-dependent methyltransferase [Treponemataceae bacterium]
MDSIELQFNKIAEEYGAGTGLLSSFWLKEFPRAQFVLVDVAEEMLSVARRRFSGLANVSFVRADYAASLPIQNFSAVISALSIHHLEDGRKQELFGRIFSALPDGGLFANYDQFCAGTPEMSRRFDSYWEEQLVKSGLSGRDIALWKERRALDRECSVEAELAMLRRCGFSAECAYSSGKFAVVMAVKE